MKFAKNALNHSIVKHGGPYSIRYRARILDFSSNVNPLGFPDIIKKSLDYKKISTYPDHDSVQLKQKLSKHLGVSIHNIAIGNGATELIYDYCRVVQSSKVLIAAPTFGEYEAASRLFVARPIFFKTLSLQADLKQFIQKIPKNSTVFVCNPNNPTGELLPRSAVLQIINAAKKKSSNVFVDECFIELTQTNQSVVDLVSRFQNLFVLRSLTKSFGLAGLRLGYAITNKELVSILNKIKIPWSVNGLAQQAGIAALSDKSFLAKTRNLIKSESEFLIDSISKLDSFSCFDTGTNFILIKTKQPAKLLQKKLLAKNILIRDCTNFRGLNQHYIRIAVRTHKENQKLVSALEAMS